MQEFTFLLSIPSFFFFVCDNVWGNSMLFFFFLPEPPPPFGNFCFLLFVCVCLETAFKNEKDWDNHTGQ